MNAIEAYEHACFIAKQRIIENEHLIYEDPLYTIKYLLSFPSAQQEYDIKLFKTDSAELCYRLSTILGRVPILEDIIIKDPEFSCKYAETRMGDKPWHIDGRFEIFDTLKKNAYWAVRYCKNCGCGEYGHMGRPDIVEVISASPIDAADYAISVLGMSWIDYGNPKVEKVIYKDPKAAYNYCYMFDKRAPPKYEKSIIALRYYGYLYKKYIMDKLISL